jgi:hypothetical protein
VAGLSGLRRDACDRGDALVRIAQHTAVAYNEPDPTAKETVDETIADLQVAGMDGYEVSITWSDLEPRPGQVDIRSLTHWLSELNQFGLIHPYMVIKTIDTNQLALPPDLVDPDNPTRLAAGRHFDDPEILDRFRAVLIEVVPILRLHGGFFLAVGNEVNIYLEKHIGEWSHYAAFVAESVAFIHELDPEMAAGVNLTWNILNNPGAAESLITLSDALSLSYYPLDRDSTGLPPEAVPDHLKAMVAISQDKPILLQEVGYPSWDAELRVGLENQAQFMAILFETLNEHREFRYVSIQHLSDWPEETCRYFEDYYGLHDDGFRNFLCSLGVISYDGQPKPAYSVLLSVFQNVGGQ